VLTADVPLVRTTAVSTTTLVPRQLPAPPVPFVGRRRELCVLDALTTEKPVASIVGLAGIGKTSLALHWAGQNAHRFPDGQLYVNLQGFAPATEPGTPAAVLFILLQALRVPPSSIPECINARTALYRSLTAGKQMLVLLDNARDTAQTVPLLPGGHSCTVLVTSRNQLTGLAALHGARSLHLDIPDIAEATRLLARRLGRRRVSAEPGAVSAIVDRCGRLPLALSIIAARAALSPDFPLAELARQLQDESGRLDALDTGEPDSSLRAAFSSSYEALTTENVRLARILAAAATGMSLAAALGTAAVTVAGVRRLLRDLVTAHLVDEYGPGLYRMHDLVRLHALEIRHRR
jgi:NB-ARC domain-containing protein